MKKVIYILFALVLALFAYWNLNDPDAPIWVAAYGLSAVLFALAVFGRADQRVSGVLTVIIGIWMLTMAPSMLDWIDADMPSITEEMQATAPHIEVVREFLGLFITVLALLGLTFSTPKEARIM